MRLTLESLPMYCHDFGNCAHWAQGVNSAGYPIANIDGKPGTLVRRYVFTALLGNDLAPRQPLVARCGHKLCVSPSCLYASTMGKVLRKAYRDGLRSTQHEYLARLRTAQRNGWAKLTDEKAAEMRKLTPEVSHSEAAKLFGVHRTTASQVRRGKSWRNSAPASSVFAWRPR